MNFQTLSWWIYLFLNGFKRLILFDFNSAFLYFVYRKEIYISFCKLLLHIRNLGFGSNASKSIVNIKSSQSPNYKSTAFLKK